MIMEKKKVIIIALFIIGSAGTCGGALLKLNNSEYGSPVIAIGLLAGVLAVILYLVFFGNRLFK